MVAELQQAVETCGLSQSQLARKTGVSSGQLSRFVRGERMLSLTAAAKLFDYFGMSIVRPAEPPPAPPEQPDPPPRRRGKK